MLNYSVAELRHKTICLAFANRRLCPRFPLVCIKRMIEIRSHDIYCQMTVVMKTVTEDENVLFKLVIIIKMCNLAPKLCID